MHKFELERIDLADPLEEKHTVYKLIINGRCEFDKFYEKTMRSGNNRLHMEKAINYLRLRAVDNLNVPNRIKFLGPDEFEVKAKQIRLYAFILPKRGDIIVLGEIKKGKDKQSKNIERMREIKIEFLKQLNDEA